jgi:hypothetical protein
MKMIFLILNFQKFKMSEITPEIWKYFYINDEKTRYQVSNMGNIKGSRGILKPRIEKSCYCSVKLYINKKSTSFLVHRLVSIVFLENINNLPQVNHKDSNKQNNNLKNLEWISASDNILHSQKGKSNGKNRPVLKYDINNIFIEKYNSIKESTNGNKNMKSGIIKCAKGKQLTAYGFKWKYEIDDKQPENIDDWSDIKDFENYKISVNGEIYSKYTKRILITTLYDKYYRLRLAKGKKYLSKAVHRLVAKTYIKNIENKPFVNHIDGNSTNNNVNNLEWCTAQENVIHAYKIGLNPRKIKKE